MLRIQMYGKTELNEVWVSTSEGWNFVKHGEESFTLDNLFIPWLLIDLPGADSGGQEQLPEKFAITVETNWQDRQGGDTVAVDTLHPLAGLIKLYIKFRL